MRRVETEGDSQSSPRRSRGVDRSLLAQKPRLRRLALDRLEDRTLMSTLPTPIALTQSVVGSGITAAPNTSSPSVAIDPLNPNKLVAAWVTNDPGNKLDGGNGQVTTYVQGAYSVNGGASWTPLPNATLADVQTDFSVAPSTSGPQPNFPQTTDATVGFGRDETAYLLTSTHSAASGVLDLQKWNFSGATPVAQAFTRPAYVGLNSSSFLNPIYRWQGGDGVLSPTLAVDNNAASFTDGTTTQADRFAGNVYVAWETVDTAPQNVTENPNTIKLMASSDNGQDFTDQVYLSDHGLGNTYDAPRIAISQGTTTTPGGQVTIVYDNAGPGGSGSAPYFDTIQTKTTATGAAVSHADSATNLPINTPSALTVPIQVNITDPKFTTLSDLTLSLSLSFPVLGDTSATLSAPDGTTVTLWNNATDAAGAVTNLPGTLTGANLGASTLGPYIGTVLDGNAHRSIFDGSVAAPYTGHFRPFGNLQTFNGRGPAGLNGTWTLTITAYRAETITSPTPNPSLIGASLDLTSGLSDVSERSASSRVGTSFLNSGAQTYTDGVQGVPVLPGASIASDNSLGSNSPHQGRLYIALTNDNYVLATGAKTTSTFIQLYTSDNFGATWTYAGIVNDDNGLTDGFSTGGYAQPGSGNGLTNPQLGFFGLEANVRPKLDPQVAVDPDTGSLVVSFLDTRNDASAVRVATYVAVSEDGGSSFAPETYANPTASVASGPVADAITGNSVNLGPIPDNESSGNNNQETTFGFGQRQGLAVLNGHIIPVWSSNLNAGSALLANKVGLHIESAVMGYTAGPRVLSSTQGPVGVAGGVNMTRAADGTPIANTIVLNFDRAVAPSSFPADGGTIGSSPIQVFYNNPSGLASPIPLRVLSATPSAGNTTYTVVFDPAGHGVGTYSYTLRPLVRGMVAYQSITGGVTSTTLGNFLDQNGNGTPGQPADAYGVPTSRNSLPLIVPGPHVTTTSVVGVNGTISTGSDNLINNDNASSINVSFDRDMLVSSFTPSQVLSVVGPAGRIDGPQTFPSTGTSKTFAHNGSYQLIPKSGTLTSTILISNTGLNVSALTVQANITDPDDSTLQLTLVAPDNTMIPLVAAGTASGANFTNTVFSDAPAANGLTSTIPAGSAPYSLTYQPASPLKALAGKTLDGLWKLMVTDSSASPAPQGRLNAWSLGITPQIPQGPTALFDSPLVISSYPDNSFKIAHLAVQLNLSATQDNQLQVFLIAPNGTAVPLILNAGGTGSNFANTTLDDSATIPIGQGAAPFGLTYRPASPLSTLNGLSLQGTWRLRVLDSNADASVSTLNSWSLIATPQLTVTPVGASNGAARTFTVGFPTQSLSGTYSVTLSPNILSVAANPANPSSGTPLDTNLNAGVDALRGISTGPTTTDKFPATAVPVAIPYAPASDTPGVLSSQINVTDNFAIQGDTLTVSGLTVSLNISYYNDPDLTVTLTAPNGKSITLFSKIGKGATTANFNKTTLSDTITPTAPITSAAAPFFGTFNPTTPLSSLTTDLNGNQAFSGGTWTLTITNSGTDPGSDTDALYPPTLLDWSLSFQKPQTSTGLGEAVADRKTVSFRLFNLNPSNPLANDTWTAVGPAGTTNSTNSTNLGGPVSVVALDPTDPSGNIAFVGASSGGVWKTSNFLTTNPSGPTYVPLTDFGPNYSINIGGIAVFGRNNDPNQSIVFAGTGNGQASTARVGNSAQGVGILRSTDGGANFTLLDSSTNVDASGNPLPEDSPLRDHAFVGSMTYKIVVDPTALPGGGVIVYAALGGKNGGLWRTLDGGNHWTNLRAGTATDVLLDPTSASTSTGNIDILYAAFQGDGVYISTNRGQSYSLLSGTVGATNLIQNSQFAPAVPLTVNDANTPNGPYGRIVLARPALTNSAAQNILYQDWLYVAVENTDGTFRGLYVTKDRGENWTLARISSVPTPPTVSAVTQALPTNDDTQANNYDVTAGATGKTHDGNSAFSLAVDPANANIVYLGGTQDYQNSGLIRVDLTGLYDAHAFVPFANDRNDGGKLTRDSTGRAVVNDINLGLPFYEGTSPGGFFGFGFSQDYTSLRHNPTNPFDTSSTLFVYNVSSFTNDGTGVKWTPIDRKFGDPLGGSTNIHQLITVVDPLTGLTRLIISDDQGVFTGVYNANGTLDTSGIGTLPAVTGSRNGNLQDEELYFSAAQPSTLAAQAAGALFYGSGVGLTDARSSSTLLSTGNLTWYVAGTSYGDLQNTIQTNDRGGVGIATDATGGVTSSNPNGNPSLYEFDVPFLGGDTTNFFRVNTHGQTTGLVNNYQAEFPANNALYNGVIPLGNFTVNPINGSQVLISSNLGNLYETTNQGVQWLQIGSGSNDFDGTYAPALAFGAPDPNGPNGVGNLNNFIYAGTVGGNIYVTQNGAGPWTSISGGLDGSSVVAIYTNPNRSSHEAYAVTLNGVYYMADSTATGASWVNITGNLTQIQQNPFSNPAFAETALLGYNNGQLGGFRSIVADYRYAVPDPVIPTTTYPVLYVAGYGGVFRSLDNGATWTVFPNISFDSAPADGGYLPNVEVTSLQLNLGAINPATGHATQVAGDPEVLLASTLGRGDFAIRLAPDVFPTTIALDPTLPSPGGSATGAVNGNTLLTNLVHPYISGTSEISNFGNLVTITLIDQANGLVIGTGTTDTFGHFSVMVGSLANDPSFALDGVKTVGIQATDSSGAKGNVTIFTYTLKATPPLPPTNLTLVTDSGRFNNDDITNVVPPVFRVGTTEPATTTVQLYRFNPALPVGQQYELVDTQRAGTATVTLTDTRLTTDFPMPPTIDQMFTYYAIQVDQATNPSTPLNNIGSDPTKLTIRVVTTPPAAPNAPKLDPSSNSGLNPSQNITNATFPLFDVSGLSSGDNLQLYRSIGGSAPILVGTAGVGVTQVRDTAGVPADGVYLYQAAQVDVAGNVSVLSMGVVVTINRQAPAQPTLVLFPADDSGAPSHPDVTNVRTPRFSGNGTPGLGIVILSVVGTDYANGIPIASAGVAADGTYLAQVTSPLPDKVYTLVARTINAAGNVSYSSPLTVTIKANGPQILPTLSIFNADDTGLKGDNATANRRPRFVGTTDKGVTVSLYSLTNGQLSSSALATTTSSTVNGSFTLQLPFQLANGNTQLVAQASDIAGNKGSISQALNLRIITVTGDYINAGAAQFTVFRPTNETYYVRGIAAYQADTTPGRDVPIQYDINGDGLVNPVAYRYNSAEYHGTLSNTAAFNFQFGNGNLSLPISGYFDNSGVFEYGLYNRSLGQWFLNLPQPGGKPVNFGSANNDIPVPAAYNTGGIAEIATFRPYVVSGGDADSFNILGSDFSTFTQVSFTDPTVLAKGFVYKAGDIPAPADYDGVGRDEVAIYRPTTGQFFILNTPDLAKKSTWTLRTVTLNLPGGPKVGDQPASLDYEGTGKASPTVYRPSNSTFYEIQTTNNIQQAVQMGLAGVDVAAAGPVIYRLTALFGPTSTPGGFTGGGLVTAATPGPGLHADAISLPSSATGSSTTTGEVSSAILPGSSTIALAMPTTVVTAAPSIPAPAPVASASIPQVSARVAAPTVALPVSTRRVTFGLTTPRAAVKSHVAARPAAHPAAHKVSPQPTKAAHKAAVAARPVKVAATVHRAGFTSPAVQLHPAASVNLGPIKKGRENA